VIGELAGARVALLEARLEGELAELVRRHGGEVVSVPAVRQSPRDATQQIGPFIEGLAGDPGAVVVFLTGVGGAQLFAQAERLGRREELLRALRRATTVCRGPKPSAELRRQQVQISMSVREPYTTAQLLETLASLDLVRRWVGLVLYGERNATLAAALTTRGAALQELQLYEWTLPADLEPLRTLVQDLIAGRFDAIAFTSQIQARHLFQVAAESGNVAELARALNECTVVASVGPTCSEALRSYGVRPHVEPARPKMRPMVIALADHLATRRHHAS
jgi:uroporphyrinogen-III synthase